MEEPTRMVDALGKVIALPGLVPLDPWVVGESDKYPGE